MGSSQGSNSPQSGRKKNRNLAIGIGSAVGAFFAILVIAAAAGLYVSQKSEEGPRGSSASSSSVAAPTTQKSSQEDEVNSRGNFEAHVGAQNGISCNNEPCAYFTVTNMQWVDSCPGAYGIPEDSVLQVDLQLETMPNIDASALTGIFNPFSFKIIDPGGYTRSAAESFKACSKSTEDLITLSAGSNYQTEYYFEIPRGSTALVLDAFGAVSWEWALPA